MNLSDRLDSFLTAESLALVRLVRAEAERLDMIVDQRRLISPDFQVGMGLCELLRGSSTVAFFPRQKAAELFWHSFEAVSQLYFI